MKLLKKLFKIILLLFLLSLFFFIGYYLSVTKDATLSPDKLTSNKQTLRIYDQNDIELINATGPHLKKEISLDKLSKTTQYAFVDTEDRRFFSHNGFDIKRIIKASLKNIQSLSFKEGASTISQQLIKNTHLSQEKTIKRKLQEMKLTHRLERSYSKEEILEKYLNTIYFGHSCFGITSAAKYYFDKAPEDLNAAESATLAGLVKSPNNYSPFKHPEKCIERRNQVLQTMYELGHLSSEQTKQAKKEILPTSPHEEKDNARYLSAVFNELESLSSEKNLKLGGNVKIYTYLDPELQEHLKSVAHGLECDHSFSVLNNTTNGFKAYYGTVNNIPRSPASLIKPLLVYAPALEENYISLETPILDEKVDYSGYQPKNYDGNYHGYVSAKDALAKSLNIPAVKILNSLGIEKAAEYLQNLGLSVDSSEYSLSLALGGMKNGFSLNELVGAYSVFPNLGEFAKPAFIKKIAIDDTTVYQRKTVRQKTFSDDTAYLITDCLKTAVKEGTAKKLSSLQIPIAAKTGTNGSSQNNLDAYAISYTPLDTVGVWLGNADNTPISYTGGGIPCNISVNIHEKIKTLYQKENKTLTNFIQPKSIIQLSLDKLSYEKNHKIILADDHSPNEYKFYGLFRSSAVPNQKASYFSNPTMPMPKIKVENGTVTITLDINTPRFYHFLIEKQYYVTHNSYDSHSTLYEGSYQECFSDKISLGSSYTYSITPIYGKIKGKTLVLPTVSYSNEQNILPSAPPEISKKDWWNY